MPSYRITIRYGGAQVRYEVLDVDAPDLRAALTDVAARLPDHVVATADLAEVRVQRDPDDRVYGPE
jgi:hypothetical protein